MEQRPTTAALVRSGVLVFGFVLYCGLAMAFPKAEANAFVVGPFAFTYYDLLLIAAMAIGVPSLLASAFSAGSGAVERTSRLVLAYLVYQAIVVIPIALWLMPSGFSLVIRSLGVRFTWLLLPAVVMLCRGERGKRLVALMPAAAAVALSVWGVYVLVTLGAGFYVEGADVRFRVLWGGSTLLFLWALLLGMSGLVSRRVGVGLITAAMVGLALTNHRSGMIAFAVAALVYVVWSGKLSHLAFWAIPGGLVVLAVVLAWGHDLQGVFAYTFTKLLDVSAGNGADRVQRWGLAWQFFVSRPVNDYVWSWRYYLVDLKEAYAPHNFVLEIAVSEGLAGIAFYSALIGGAVHRAMRSVRQDAQIRVLVAYIVGYLTFCLANTNMYSLANMALLVCAVGALVVRIDEVEYSRLSFDAQTVPSKAALYPMDAIAPTEV